MKTNNKINENQKIYISKTGLVSSAGIGCTRFWDALKNKDDFSRVLQIQHWPDKAKIYWESISKDLPKACLFPDSIRHNLQENPIKNVFAKLFFDEWKRKAFDDQIKDSSLGIIFTSSKGNTEDYIWDKNFKNELGFSRDPYRDILDHFIKLTGFKILIL